MALQLGPFTLLEPIAKGGMGEVWRGVHDRTGVSVAVKLLLPRAARDSRATESFETEMRAVAGLDHPGIIHLFDHGLVDAAAAAAAEGGLVEGSPYLVMEHASGGTLASVKQHMPWPLLRGVLLAVLDALAHAHSRGVIHRDLKPANVLACTRSDLRPGWKLTDFGIAHAIDSHAAPSDAPAGTLHFMAPEQLLGAWRDHGPPTDLYALGVIAWRLACSKLPFSGMKGERLMVAQLRVEAPPLEPVDVVPEGFGAWVARLLLKRPEDRFQRAADAAAALVALGAPAEAAEDVEDEPTAPGGAGVAEVPGFTTRLNMPLGDIAFGGDVPPIPRSWRREDDARLPMGMVGAGLRLFGMRTIPLVGRESERDTLWAALRAVHRTHGPRLVHVHGEAGVGKTRLVGSIAERAHEVGAVTVLGSGSGGGSGEAVRRLAARLLQTQGLDRDGVIDRLETWFEARGGARPADVNALAELLVPSEDASAAGAPRPEAPTGDGHTKTNTRLMRIQSAKERYGALLRVFDQLASSRPLLVVLDDVHLSADAIGLAEALLERDIPALVVLVSLDGAWEGRDVEAFRLEHLVGNKRSEEIELGPLPAPDHERLVSELLHLEPALAARVAEKTLGNPLFAVELVGEWVERGVLVADPRGLVLAPGAQAVLPEGLHAVWGERIDRLVSGLPVAAELFLEQAAALGLQVDEEEWAELCDDPQGTVAAWEAEGSPVMFSPTNARLRNQVVDRLLRGRAAIETDTGWAFTHPLVRESLVRRARDGGRWAGINRGAARMLRGRAEEDADLVAERIGMHLLEAGMADASVAPLLRGILERGNASGYRPALALAATCEHALTIAGAPQSDSRWGSLALERARLEYHHGAFEAAARQVERVLASARRHGWGRIVRDALVLRADIHTRRGAHDAAAEDLAVVRREAIAEGDRVGQGLAALGLGRVARVLGHLDDASERIVEACKLLTGRELEPELAACWREMGSIELQQGDPTRAATLFSKARAAFERRGRSLDVAACLNGLAEVDRRLGRQAEAERGYERSLALYQAIGSGDEAVVRLNLSALAVERGDWAAASEQGERASRALSDQGHLQLAAGAKVVLTAAAAGARDWRAFDDHLRAAVRALHGLSSFDHDNATMAERAGDLAEAAGESERAADVYSLAWVQWQGLGDGDGQRRVGAKMG